MAAERRLLDKGPGL